PPSRRDGLPVLVVISVGAAVCAPPPAGLGRCHSQNLVTRVVDGPDRAVSESDTRKAVVLGAGTAGRVLPGRSYDERSGDAVRPRIDSDKVVVAREPDEPATAPERIRVRDPLRHEDLDTLLV